ncbi:serine--tRNA ligase [Candidatus Peregrinibacteria bacterium]|nr:serine--tRNA ligase [Candidatus Peregrinibacteria bacterium]
MLDIKAIRENPKEYQRKLARKGVSAHAVAAVLELDEKYRSLLKKVEQAKSEQNKVSKEMPKLSGAEKEKVLANMKKLSEEKKEAEMEQEKVGEDLKHALEALPNPPEDSAPDGKSEEENQVLRKEGSPRKFDFTPLEHSELGEKLRILDLDRGAKVAGSRFFFLRNELAILQMALMNWAFLRIAELGFSPMIPPFVTRKEAIYGTGYLSKDENYVVNPGEDDLYLIATSEVPLTSFHADEILEEDMLPIKFAGYSPCFRREAGSYGKDMKGILRVHQFEKIEMVILCKPEDSAKMHELIREVEEALMKELKIPYQVVNICTGDLGNSAAKKYDLEAWLPGQNKYREVTSTSICTDFQSRRLNIRYRKKDGTTDYVHTLNGTAVSSRPLIAILENFQKKNGSVDIPECLWKFTGFKRIEPK